jgi:hypothetical protein
MTTLLAFFLLGQVYYIFTYLGTLKTWFVVGILRFEKWFDLDIFDFQFELCYRYFGIFQFRDFLSNFSKNWAFFSQNLWSPC